MKIFKIRALMQLTLYVFFLLALTLVSANAEWLACDIPAEDQGVTQYAVVMNGGDETLVPYTLNSTAEYVLLWDVSNITTAQFEISAVNDQGRRSSATPFVLKAAPSPSSGYRLIKD